MRYEWTPTCGRATSPRPVTPASGSSPSTPIFPGHLSLVRTRRPEERGRGATVGTRGRSSSRRRVSSPRGCTCADPTFPRSPGPTPSGQGGWVFVVAVIVSQRWSSSRTPGRRRRSWDPRTDGTTRRAPCSLDGDVIHWIPERAIWGQSHDVLVLHRQYRTITLVFTEENPPSPR